MRLAVRSLVEEYRDFSFHFWLNQPALGYVFTRLQRHVREQHAVIGLIDPKLLPPLARSARSYGRLACARFGELNIWCSLPGTA